MAGDLAALEAELLDEAAAALEEWAAADRALAALDEVTWGPVVGRWHEARARVLAWRAFGVS